MSLIDPKTLDLLKLLSERPEILDAAIQLASNPQAIASLVPPKATIREFQAEYEKEKKPIKGADPSINVNRIKSWNSVQGIHWTHLLPHFGEMTPATTPPEVFYEKAFEYQRLRLSQYRMARAKGGKLVATKHRISPATVNLEINTLKALLNWCVQRNKLARNPMSGFPDLVLDAQDEEKRSRKFPITYEDFLAILEHVPPVTRLMLILAHETGMRRDEFRLLEWTEVNMNGEVKTITLPRWRTKEKKEKRIILSDVAVAAIQAAPRMTPSRYVFPNPARIDGSPVPKGTLGDQFRVARKEAGVKGPLGQEIWIHTLRKTYAVNKALSGMPIYGLMEQLGHSSKDVHDEYTRMGPDHLKGLVRYVNEPPPRLGPRPIGEPASHDPKRLIELITGRR